MLFECDVKPVSFASAQLLMTFVYSRLTNFIKGDSVIRFKVKIGAFI
jgi:hypothetical protein